MALWQKDYFAIPSQKLREIYGVIPAGISEEDFLKRPWWNGISASAPTRQEIAALLPVLKQMDGMEIFGTDAGNRIQVVYSDDRKSIVELLIRINEMDDGCFVRQIVDVCAKHKLLLVAAASGSVLPPDYETIIKNMNLPDTHGLRATA